MHARRWFPEPEVPDDSAMGRLESLGSYLARSTAPRAAEVRTYYNAALEAIPAGCAESLRRRIARSTTIAPRFELHVGRFLQVRGATELECEPELAGGRRVDWRATFPDGILHVEATVPVYNAGAGVTARRHQRLLDVIEKRAPKGWWLMPFRLPPLPESAPLRPFTRLVEELVGQLPPAGMAAPETVIQLGGRLPGPGRTEVRITAVRTTTADGGLGAGAAVGYVDNSELRVAAAWQDRRKRSQGRSAPPPAVLAILGGFLGADLDDFDRALFGRDLRAGRPAQGAMAVDADPPWAGVLAFPDWSEASAPDPVLYVAPAFAGGFPDAVARLEVRRLAGGLMAVQKARDRNVTAAMRWAQP